MRTHYLRTLRIRRRLTQESLARLCGIAQNTISKLESNRNAAPAFATVKLIARALQVHPNQLRFGPDPKAVPRAPKAEQVAS
jgi:transcriptional regulator with XRE-family HTH domain